LLEDVEVLQESCQVQNTPHAIAKEGSVREMAPRNEVAAAVEASERMAKVAQKIVSHNHMDAASGGQITVLAARVEDVSASSIPKVRLKRMY
jgi:hypothetical protein